MQTSLSLKKPSLQRTYSIAGFVLEASTQVSAAVYFEETFWLLR